MPVPDPKDIAEIVRQTGATLDKANTLCLTLERMHLDLKGFDVGGFIKELPALLASFK